MIKEVYLVLKTHLDIGYTDYADVIVKEYINTFIPQAIKVGNELKDTDTPFVWTVGSWLAYEALKYDKDGSVKKAIEDGILTWHALPCTTHTELMSKKLFEYGISLSTLLDKQFGKKTISAKMTDVPGHTIAMVPILKKHGIRFLHIGVNPATPVPEVPKLFRWKNGDDEIVVMYQGYYGLHDEFEDFAVCFAHTNDNCGPQSADEIKNIYAEISAKYPGAVIKAASLDDVANRILQIKNLPVVDKEIGDTWIHGGATDPKKLANFRELMRFYDSTDKEFDLSDNLLMIPEHTWGMSVQKFFPNTQEYDLKGLENAIARGDTDVIAKSWEEQRQYIEKSCDVLGHKTNYEIPGYNFSKMKEIDAKECGIELSWQIFDNSNYEHYKKCYLRLTDDNREWALWDYTKPGLHDYKGGIYVPELTKAYTDGKKEYFVYKFDKKISEEYGLPKLTVTIDSGEVTVVWTGKKALRMPNACWLKFKGQKEQNWQIRKLGEWINADDVIASPLVAATDYGVKNDEVEIECMDSAVVAPYGRRLLDFCLENDKQDMYFNLYNNIWDTNFPMWYSDDAIFTFKIKNI